MVNKVSELDSKPHFHILDGLRGVAALVILVFHYLEFIYLGDYVNNPLGHGFLAVDFFFCLSGFVVAYAYDDRIGKIGVKGFFIKSPDKTSSYGDFWYSSGSNCVFFRSFYRYFICELA